MRRRGLPAESFARILLQGGDSALIYLGAFALTGTAPRERRLVADRLRQLRRPRPADPAAEPPR